MAMKPGLRFDALEGMRAYLALWVVASHILQFTTLRHLPGLNILADAGYGVQSFMILSGFVIAHLLVQKNEGYPVYITRRFLRLFPVFITWLLLGWLTMNWLADGVAMLPWADDPDFASFRDKWALRRDLVEENTLGQLLVHLTMLHGAVPAEVLPEASRTFLSPAWSISLEWQFYLLAPLAVYFLRKTFGVFLVLAGIVAGLLILKTQVLGTFDEAFLGTSAIFLIIGSVSRLMMPKLMEIPFHPLPVAAFACVLVQMFTETPLSLLPWAFVFPFVIDAARGGHHAWFDWIFKNKVTMYLGRISYSIYLAHFVGLSVAVYLLVYWVPDITQVMLLFALSLSVLPILAASMLSYQFVEKPGIDLGKRWANRLRRPEPAVSAATP